MFERFTDRARRVLVLAQEEARLADHSFIGTEHLLLGLIHEGDGLAANVLESFGVSLDAVRSEISSRVQPSLGAPNGSPPFTPRAKKVLELALREALQMGHHYIGTEHLLLGLVREGQGVAAEVLEQAGVELAAVRTRVLEKLGGSTGSERSSGVIGLGPRRHTPNPTSVIAGPPMRLTSDGIVFRTVGVLCYESEFRVLWRIAGIPKAIADVMGFSESVTSDVRHHPPIAYVSVTDDLDTVYVSAGSTLDAQPGGEWAGTSSFSQAISERAGRLEIHWQGELLAIELPGAS